MDDPEDNKNVFVNISLEPEKSNSRKPLVLIAMIDVSSSMSISSSQDMKGNKTIPISRLGLVKHSLKTIASILDKDDKMSLIIFNSTAKVCLEATNMNIMGRRIMFDEIEKMKAIGFTNIWDALRLGMIEAQKYDENYNISLLLFTDGEPNQNPPKGIIPTLKKYLSDIKDINFTISTFAFGYEIDSILMEEIAQIGNGIYGYCPDCTMVGTVFINFMANVLNTVEPIVKINVKNEKLQTKFEIGGLYNGISRHLGFFLNKKDFKNTEISLFFGKEEKGKIKGIDYTEKNTSIMDQYYRNKLISFINDNLKPGEFDKKAKETKKLYYLINKKQNKTEFMKNILIDLINKDPNHGQIEKAFSKEHYNKWGLNYLLSFLRFHILEQCGNFKDQSLKQYECKEFEELRNKGNKIFVNFPPPENDFGEKNADKVDSVTFNNFFYNAGGGCFNGDVIVELENGKKKVKNLRKGDILSNGAIVECLVENKINREENVVKINDVYFSLYHPIELNGEWVFPCEHFKVIKKYIDCWYNLVLKNKHEIILNGVKAITLGHNRTEGILKHPYFGTNKVIKALKKYDSYNSGFITTSNLKVHRTNNLIDEYY